MNTMIVIYVSCVNKEEAVKIGDAIMKKRLAPCYNILPHTTSVAFWPPKSGEVEKVEGVVLLIKTIKKNYQSIETEIKKLHSDTNPCIFALPAVHVSKEYYQWLLSEMKR